MVLLAERREVSLDRIEQIFGMAILALSFALSE